MSQALFAITRSTPCCARITPTRTGDWRSTLRRWAERCRDALHAAGNHLREHEQLPALDAATLRDLGLSHAPAAWTPRACR
ncbi:hypothetical protein [uncultured Piscinibacter sp.]|uniref:hypothetical protein n=1 Tax=uncultured Piscinibacter sp. TaxID=1131835 RepID=UPI00262F844E|nr:hypothetical protein [uncultured Piscinibacter sp.]